MKLKVLSMCIILCSVLIEVYTLKHVPQEVLDIKESGFTNTNIGSIAIVFYLVVYNPSRSLAPLEITYEKCCIEEDDERQDCTVMTVYGGYVGTISARHTMNVTFIYPTQYPYDMVGHCIVLLKTETFTQVIKIPFDTTLDVQNPVSWLPVGVNEYLFTSSVPKKCQSRDEDRFNDCSPVMCDLKYHGHRNHFDRRTKKCTVKRECPGSYLQPPVTVYDNRTNSCRNLSQPMIITEEVKKLLSKPQEGVEDFKTVDWKIERRLDCNYGRISPNRSTCICSAGWQSLVLPDQEVDPSTGLLQMCNQGRKSYWKHYVVGVVLVATTITWLYISFYLCLRERQKKRYREKSEFSPAKSGPFHKLHEQFSPKDEYDRMSMMGRLCHDLCCKLQPRDENLDESIEYERKSKVTRWSRNVIRKLQPKENKLDFSVDEIRASRLSPPSLAMGADLEINLKR